MERGIPELVTQTEVDKIMYIMGSFLKNSNLFKFLNTPGINTFKAMLKGLSTVPL